MLAAVTALVLAVAVPSQAVDEAATSLRSDPVYVDPAATVVTEAEADDLRDRIASTGAPVFIAVFPDSAAGGDLDSFVRQLEAETRRAGFYAVIVGRSFRAEGGEAATSALNAGRDRGAAAILGNYIEEIAAGTGGSGGSGSETADDGGDGGGGGSLLPIALLGGGGVALYAVSKRRRNRERAEEARALAADVQLLRAELSVLSEDVMRLEPEVALHPDARIDYDAAVDRFRAASAALDYADEPVDLIRVERVVAEARYAMARARAIVAGHEPPPPPQELRQPGRHDEPPLDVDEYGRPVYAGGAPFYGGGWFGGGGGLFSGLLLGSMLGGFGGWGWGGGWGGGFGGGDGDGGGGDFGGGDFGGGDFGGGDFGGGDFGGGDF